MGSHLLCIMSVCSQRKAIVLLTEVNRDSRDLNKKDAQVNTCRKFYLQFLDEGISVPENTIDSMLLVQVNVHGSPTNLCIFRY